MGSSCSTIPTKGNCASCHLSERARDGTPPQFTDYGLIAIGVPRNNAIPANEDPGYFDLGACGPLRTGPAGQRRVLRAVQDAVVAQRRDPPRVLPQRRLPHARGSGRLLCRARHRPRPLVPARRRRHGAQVRRPAARYWDNLNADPPFDRHPGDPPALSASEIADVVAFLQTLTDGERPAKAAQRRALRRRATRVRTEASTGADIDTEAA